MDLYGVVGNPARHSLSPWLHKGFARRAQCQMHYGIYETDGENIAAFFAAFFNNGGAGLNITAPFKQAALEFADSASAFARRARAANVLAKQQDGNIIAYNTDGAGLICDIRRHLDIAIRGRRVLLAGAGGAARAAALALAEQQPALLQIAARDAQKAQQLAQTAADDSGANCGGCQITKCSAPFDIVINATAAGQIGEKPNLPPQVFDGAQLALDMGYGANAKPFLAAAKAAKQGADGVGMLAEQAAATFALWHRRYPNAAESIAILRKATNNYWRKEQ